MKKKMKRITALLLVLVMQLALLGFGGPRAGAEGAPEIPGLTFEGETELEYAQCFHLYRYAGGYTLIAIEDGDRFLVVPEDGQIPTGLDDGITVLRQPLDRIYLAATSAMSLFNAVGALDHIRLTGTRASGWYIDAAVEALNSGAMHFAGKYSEPDYELMISQDCNLAIESTMIYHTPKVKEMIEDLGIPVLVDRSSYEPHPLGRTEWIKLYAVLVDREDEATAFFDRQAAVIRELEDFENTGRTVAFFAVNSDGSVSIRKPGDYIPRMIELAGGRYAFEDFVTDQAATSISITMEDFYAKAVDADVLIYNASIAAPISTVDELLALNALFADFKGVKEGNVWCTGKSFYQATDIVGQMIRDIHLARTGGDERQMTFLTRVA